MNKVTKPDFICLLHFGSDYLVEGYHLERYFSTGKQRNGSTWVHKYIYEPVCPSAQILPLLPSQKPHRCSQSMSRSCLTQFFNLQCLFHMPVLLTAFTFGYFSLFTSYSFNEQARVASSRRPARNRVISQVLVHLHEAAFSYKHKQSWEIWTQSITTRQLDKKVFSTSVVLPASNTSHCIIHLY